MKKLIAVLMAVMMFVLPVSGMAEAKHLTIGMQHGSLAELITTMTGMDAEQAASLQQAVNELIDCVGLDAYVQETQAGVALTLSGNKAVKLDAGFDGETVRIASNLLGDQVVCIGLEETVAYVRNMVGAEQFDQIMAQFQEAIAGFAGVSGENMLADMTMENTMALVMDMMGRVTVEEVTEEVTGFDQPAQIYTLNLTGADIAGVYKALIHDFTSAKAIAAYVDAIAQQQEMTAEQLLAAADEELDKAFGEMGEIPYQFYVSAEGELVAAVMSYAVQETEFDVIYARNTADDGVTHTINMSAGEIMNISFVADLGADGTTSFTYGVVGEGMYYVMNLAFVSDDTTSVAKLTVCVDEAGDGFAMTKIATKVENGTQRVITFELIGEQLTALVSDPVLLTVNIDTMATADEAAISGTEARVMSMTEEELGQWVGSVSATAMIEAIGIMQYLPASTMSLLQYMPAMMQ